VADQSERKKSIPCHHLKTYLHNYKAACLAIHLYMPFHKAVSTTTRFNDRSEYVKQYSGSSVSQISSKQIFFRNCPVDITLGMSETGLGATEQGSKGGCGGEGLGSTSPKMRALELLCIIRDLQAGALTRAYNRFRPCNRKF